MELNLGVMQTLIPWMLAFDVVAAITSSSLFDEIDFANRGACSALLNTTLRFSVVVFVRSSRSTSVRSSVILQ